MASLGDFGAALRELDPKREKDTFTYFGETFVVEGDIPGVVMLQLGAAVSGKIAEAEGMAAMWEALRFTLDPPATLAKAVDDAVGNPGPTGFARFYKLAADKRDSMDGLMHLVFKLFEVQGGRPTEQAPTSSAGLPGTSPSSKPSSSHPGLAHLRPVSEVLAG